MIDVDKHGIEEGDLIRITIEGTVEKVDATSWAPEYLAVGGVALADHPSYRIEPSVEILEKAEPKWHSAQVVKADEGIFLKADMGAAHWVDCGGIPCFHDDLSNVEVLVP